VESALIALAAIFWLIARILTIFGKKYYRKRHDSYKMRLLQLCQWAGVDAEVEVFNLFAGSIPQEGLSRMERGRKVQSIVPDMRISNCFATKQCLGMLKMRG